MSTTGTNLGCKIVAGGGILWRMRIKCIHTYDDIISIENLLDAWNEFVKGKRNKKDVQEFQYRFMDNILNLHQDLKNKTYTHGKYEAFNISDPKPRNIHKASVRDRLLHHAIYRILYPFFDKTFLADSYSCRLEKGTHKALKRFQKFGRKESQNNTKTVWILKCDVKKFFASIDQKILLDILKERIQDKNILSLLGEIIGSFYSTKLGKGLPLGNLTSQLLVNIYMNEFDQFMKHKLKAKYYIRYADDFVIFSQDKSELKNILLEIESFLDNKLKLNLHPNKVSIETLASGVDFLGWTHFPNHRSLRTVTKRRMFKNIQNKKGKEETVQSYLRLLSHGVTEKLKGQIVKILDI